MTAPSVRSVATLAPFLFISIAGCSDGGSRRPKLIVAGLESIQFAQRQDIKTGQYATNVAVGDVNGDHRPDLLVINYQESKVRWIYSFGNGVFGAGAELPPGPLFPLGAALADVTNDGVADAIVTDFENAKMFVYQNSGTGLTAPVGYDTTDGPVGIAAADYNLDGEVDVAISGVVGAEIRMHRGQGGGSFDQGFSIPVVGLPLQLYAHDINDDGRPDLVCSDMMASRMRLLSNAPSNSNSNDADFSEVASAETGEGPFGLAVGDLDGDLRPEFVTSSAAQPFITVWKYHNNGLTPVTVLSDACPTGAIKLADLNADGKFDLAATCPAANGIVVWQGKGDTTFEKPIFRATGVGPVFLAVEDTTGDGAADVHVAAALSGEVSIFHGQPGAGAPVSGPPTIAISGNPQLIASGDLDGDSIADLVATDNAEPRVFFLRGLGGMGFATEATIAIPAGSSTFQPLLFDMDQDGDLDVAVLHDNGATFIKNNGSFAFTQASNVVVSGGLMLGRVADVYEDGWPEIVATAPAAGASMVFKNNHGTMTISQSVAAGMLPAGIAVEDLDRDGDLDIAVANRGSDTISIAKRTGATFIANATVLPAHGGPAWLHSADFDLDGRHDLAVSVPDSDDILIFKNRGALKFKDAAAVPTNGQPLALAVEDLDRDGRADLLYVENTTGKAVVRLAGKNMVFGGQKTVFASQYTTITALLSDLDGDGLPELVTANASGGIMQIHKNLSN